MTAITEGRSQVAYPIPENAIVYLPVPVENPGVGQPTHTDGWATIADIRKTLKNFILVANAQSPFAGGMIEDVLIDVSGGSVQFVAPADPAPNKRYRLISHAGDYAVNSLFIMRNGKPIMGGTDDVEVNVTGYNLELLYIDDTYGWKIIPF